MKYFVWLWLFSGVIVYGSSLQDVIASTKNNPSIQSADQQTKLYQYLYEAAQSKNYPSLDLSYGAAYLNEKPVIYFNKMPIQAQAQNLYTGALKLTYPLFTGFAISAGIETARLEVDRAKLKADDAKRNLYLGIIQVYVGAVSIKQILVSQHKALEATQKSHAKVKGFFDQGISSASELYRIEASLHAIKAQITETKNRYDIALNQLSMMSKTKIDDVEQLPPTKELVLTELQKEALKKRPDLQAMRLMVKEQESKIQLAKSENYPTVALYGQLSQIGDDPSLDGDGYTNKDRSAVGFQLSYNLFCGFKTQKQIEAAKVGKISTQLMLQSYHDKVSTEVYESYLSYQSLLSQKEAAKAQVKAQESYEKLIEGQFKNQLADADRLSRAISLSELARASLIMIEAKLYATYSMALLQVDNETFLSSLKP